MLSVDERSMNLTYRLPLIVLLAFSSAAVGAVPTFTKDIAPILLEHCANCHGSLLSYDAARSSANAIREQVLTRAMPPWPADPARSLKFRNDARLSEPDIAAVVAWVDAGTPKGDDAELRRLPDLAREWLNPEGRAPDAIVSLPVIHVGPKGEVPYIQQLIKVPVDEDKWIVAMQLRAGNRNLLHHMGITEVALPEGMGPAQINEFAALARKFGIPDGSVANTPPAVVDPTNADAYDMLGVYTPGSTFEAFADDSGKLLKGGKNYYINFNIHYTTTGKPESDRSQLGLWFRSTPPRHQLIRAPVAVKTIIADGKELLTDAPGTKAEGTVVAIPPIPAYAQNYEVIGISAYTQPVTIYQLQPHAHMRAKDFTYVVVYPEGRELVILTVPKYDFHWQLAYQLDQPLTLPPGSKLIVRAHYDNSQIHYDERVKADDPGRNCGPENVAYFRRQNQSWDEMFSPLAQYAVSGFGSAARNRDTPHIVQVVGCLKQDHSSKWLLTKAGEPVVTNAQATSMAELKAAAATPLGVKILELLGIDVFNPRGYVGQKVAVKGVLIQKAGSSRVNVTSLQTLAAACD
jgi:mono/diheme cytochrome c family protein